jgi:hypothetical protein
MARTMKVQNVISQAIAKKITWWQAEILGINDPHMRSCRKPCRRGLQRVVRPTADQPFFDQVPDRPSFGRPHYRNFLL